MTGLMVALAALTGVVAGDRPTAGVILATVPIGANPSAVALDARTGRLYVLGDDDTVRVLDGPAGRPALSADVTGFGGPMVLDERGGRLALVSNLGNGVRLLDPRTGAVVASRLPIAGGVYPIAPALDTRSGRLFIADTGQASSLDESPDHGRVTVVDARRGAIVRTVLDRMYPRAMAVDARANRIYVAAARHINASGHGVGPGSLSVLDGTSGRVLASVGIPADPRAVLVDAGRRRVFVVTTSGGGGWLSAIAVGGRAPRLLRTVAVGGAPTAPLLDARDGRVLLTSVRGLVLADAGSGRVARVVPFDGGVGLAATLDERRRRAFIVTARGVLVVDPRDGRIVRAVRLPLGALTSLPLAAAPPLAEDGRTGRLYVAAAGALYPAGNPQGAGVVYVLDARDGRVLHAAPVGLLPGAVAVDERRGRAYVVNRGCPAPAFACGAAATPPADPWAWAPRPLRRLLPSPTPVGHARPAGGSISILDTAR